MIKFWSLWHMYGPQPIRYAPWLTKSSKLFKTLSCTQIFLTIPNLENSALYLSSHSSFVLDHLPSFWLWYWVFQSSRHLLIIPKQTKISWTYTRSYIYPFAFQIESTRGFRSLLYLVSFSQLYCWKAFIFTRGKKGQVILS